MRSAVIVLVLCAFACFASASELRSNSTMHAKVLSRDNYAATCIGISLSGATLFGRCQDRMGRWKPTALNLNSCFENRNGLFNCGTGWANSADKVSLSGSTLNADLRTISGNWLGSSIELNNYISNLNGVLTCDCTRNW